MAPCVLLALLAAAVSGTSHDPLAPSKGYVYDVPADTPQPALLPALSASSRGFSYPDGYSYVYAVQHPDSESNSRVEVTRFSSGSGRALSAPIGIPSSLPPQGSLLAVQPVPPLPSLPSWPAQVEQGPRVALELLQPGLRHATYSYALGAGSPLAAPLLLGAPYESSLLTPPPVRSAAPYPSYFYPA
ncbi:hypothetical protein FOCC_FOCC002196 [Frankliniella occidentalis]|nr:hypothetical protein FOCC_FOCC002196 [Frankliniella occidentalis]